MPPEDNANSTPSGPEGSAARTPDGVLPPEGTGNSSGERNGSRVMVMPPTAPKGKPRAPPLIHGKIKPSEADMDIDSGGSGSKIPLLKSKADIQDVGGEPNPSGSDHRRKRNSITTSSLGGGSNPKSSRSVKSDSGRSVAATSSSSTQYVHRTVEKVKLPKGIEMKRVVQETNGIKTKRFSTTNVNSSTAVSSQNMSAATTLTTKESSHQHPSTTTNDAPHRRKMTKTEVTFAGEVKSFMPHHHPPPNQSNPTVAGSSLTNTKSNEKNKSPGRQQPVAAKNGVGGFKTVDEFLAMPTTSLPDHKPPASPDKKKSSMYKSKFWEYIEPSKNPSTSARSKGPSKGKPYDPDAVKHFMIKQREQRRIQHIRETREKELEASKRKAMLKELENKYQRQRMLQELERKYNQTQRNQQQNTKNKLHARVRSQGLSNFESAAVVQKTLTAAGKVNHAPPPPPPSENISGSTEAPSSKKLKIMENQSPSMKYLKPLLERKTSQLLTMRKSSESQQSTSSSLDVAKQSQYLLSEFENIVKRECISFLQKIPIPPPCTPASQISFVEPPQKCDKSVATSLSLLDLAPVSLQSKYWSSKDLKDMEDGTNSPSTPTTTSASSSKATKKSSSRERPPSRRRVRSPLTAEKAVTTIQAVYRGYKVRQALKEAKVSFYHHNIHNYQKPTALHKRCTQLQNELGGAKASDNRRWSLPRMPEKPYSSERLMPMSPIPFSSDTQMPCYIPPPSPGAGGGATGHNPNRSPSKPRVLPSFPLTPVRFRYEDPYPKSATKPSKTNDLLSDFTNGNSTSSVAESQDNLQKPSFVTIRPKKESLPVPFDELTPRNSGNLEFMVPSSMPSIVDVLREKLRLFQQQELLKAPPPSQPPAQQTEKPLGFGAEDPATPKIKKHKRRSRPLKSSPVAESSTTVDTDGEFQGPTTTRSSGSVRSSSRKSHSRHHNRQGSKSEETITSSVTPGGTEVDSSTAASTTGDGSFGGCLEPALRLRYEAERERLKIIEKALQVRLEKKAEVIPSPPTNKSTTSGGGAEVDRVQLAIANCQKESMKAAAEMAKWMSEFQKSTREQEKVIVQQQAPAQVPSHVDLAATVYAAVEHARIMGIEKRRETQKKSSHKISQSQKSIDQTTTDTDASRQDKASETNLIHAPKVDVVGEVKKKKEVVVEVIREIRDYQQQFPSGSERDSPAISLTKEEDVPPPIPLPPSAHLFENDEDVSSVVNDEPVDYPSIVPSGNSIEFTSLDPKMVSTLDYASQITTTTGKKEEEDEEVMEEDDTFVDEDDLPTTSASKVQEVDDVEESALYSLKSSVADEASSIQNEKEDPKLQDIAVEIPSEEEEQQSSKVEQVEDEIDDFFDEPSDQGILTQSKIEEVISSEIEDVAGGEEAGTFSAEQSKIEEEIVESNDTVTPTPAFDLEEVKEEIIESNDTAATPTPALDLEEVKEEIVEINDTVTPTPTFDLEEVKEEIVELNDIVTPTPTFDLEEVKEEIANSSSGSFVLSQIEDAAIRSLEQSIEEVKVKKDDGKKLPEELEEPPAVIIQEVLDSEEEEKEESQKSMLEIKTASVAIEEMEENSKETDLSEEIEDKATETELPEDEVDNLIEEDKRISSEEGINVEEKRVALVPDIKVPDFILKSFPEVDHKDKEEEKDESQLSKVELDEEERISVIEDLVEDDDEEEEEENKSGESQLQKQASVEETTVEREEVEEEDLYEDKFEEDVTVTTTEQSKVLEEEKEEVEEKIEEEGKEEDSKSSASAPSSSEPEVPYFKPPPPYSSLFKEKQEDADLPPDEISSAKEVSQQSGESISEEAPSSSQIIDDEASSAAEEEDKLDDKVSAEVAAAKPEFEVPLKPPPPYSPTSSLESTSLSSRSLMLSLPSDKLETLIKLQVDLICGEQDFPNSVNFPGIQQVMANLTEQNQITSITTSSAAASSFPIAAEQSFDVLLCHLIYETMKEAIQLENKYTSFVEKVRPGPLSLQAQKLKIPKSKEALVRIVLRRLLKTIPQQFFSSDAAEDSTQGAGVGVEYKSFGGGGAGGGSRLRKWCSRPRELVDEILLEELIDEDYQWTEWWPEEVIVQYHTSRKIIQNLVRSALQKRNYVYGKTQHHQEQRRQ